MPDRKLPRPDVTIFADASVSRDRSAAGWGCWIKANRRASIVRGGSFRGAIPDVTLAELCALANAVQLAQIAKLLKGHVLLESDATRALGAIRQRIGAADNPIKGGLAVECRRRRLPKEYDPALVVLSAALKGLTVSVRHVRGHQEGKGRNWVNRECDRLAKAGMVAALDRQKLTRGELAHG